MDIVRVRERRFARLEGVGGADGDRGFVIRVADEPNVLMDSGVNVDGGDMKVDATGEDWGDDESGSLETVLILSLGGPNVSVSNPASVL